MKVITEDTSSQRDSEQGLCFHFFVSYYITQNTNLPSRSSQSVQHMAPFITIPDSLHDILNRVGLGFDSTVNHIALYDLIITWRFCRPDFKQINRHMNCRARIISSTVCVCDLENVARYRLVHRFSFCVTRMFSTVSRAVLQRTTRLTSRCR